MRRYTLHAGQFLGIFLVLVAGVVAGPPPITVTDAGYFATVVDDDGYPSFVRITVTDLRTGKLPPITPEDPVPPTTPDPPPSGISADAASWASEANDAEGAQRYALMLETVRDGVLDGKVSPDNLFRVLRESADIVVGEQWDTFRRKFADFLTERLQAGDLLTSTSIAEQLARVHYGVAYSANGSDSISEGDALAVVSKTNSVIARVVGE